MSKELELTLVNEWSRWPFQSVPNESWLVMATRGLFCIAVLALIVIFIRVMFGPKGFFRDEEIYEESRMLIREEREQVEEDYKQNKISEREYTSRMRHLKEDK